MYELKKGRTAEYEINVHSAIFEAAHGAMTLVSNTTTNLSFFLTQSGQRCNIVQLCRSTWDRASQPRAGPDYTSAQKLFSPLPVLNHRIANCANFRQLMGL